MKDTQGGPGVASGLISDAGQQIHDLSLNIRTSQKIDYMADLVSELQEMAERGGLKTLAGLLALAHVEALQQAAVLKK